MSATVTEPLCPCCDQPLDRPSDWLLSAIRADATSGEVEPPQLLGAGFDDSLRLPAGF